MANFQSVIKSPPVHGMLTMCVMVGRQGDNFLVLMY